MIKSPVEKALEQAKVQIVIAPNDIHRPAAFFSTILLNLPINIDSTIESACTDGTQISINPDKITEWGVENTKGVLIHEVLHIARGHHIRRNGRDPHKWNMACDYEINPIIRDAGFSLPTGVLENKGFKGMSAEEIYSLLPPGSNSNNNQGNGDNGGGNGIGEVKDAPKKSNDPAEAAQMEQDWRVMVNKAAIAQKLKGNLPDWIKRFIEEINEPKEDWKAHLTAFLVDALNPMNYSWQRPNKRYISHGLYLPSIISDKKADIVVFADTSGSMTPKDLEETGSELSGIMEVTKTTVHVVYIDAAVAHVQTFEPGDQIILEAKGGGGTDFRPGFQWLKEQEDINPAAVVYFTDGYGTFPEEEIIPTLWAMTTDVEPPFGQCIKLNS